MVCFGMEPRFRFTKLLIKKKLMENTLLISAALLFFAFIIGLVKPSVIIRKGKASRGKIFSFLFLPAFVLFLIVGVIGNRKTAEALENPGGVEKLRLNSKGYEDIPVFLKDFKDLKSLSLKNNDISTFNKTLLSMPLLEELDLSMNPINTIPDWVTELTNLEKLDLDKTNIDSIPQALLSSGLDISYIGTPLYVKMNEQKNEEASQKKESDSGEESLGDFAIRKLLGNEHGYKKSFKKGDLYYIKPVTDVQADSLGAFLTETGFFNDDQNVSMQITFNSKIEKPTYELRAITDKEINEDIKSAFKLQALLISLRVFEGEPLDFHLCDDQFNTHTILSSSD